MTLDNKINSCVRLQKSKSNSETTITHLYLILTKTSFIQPIQILQELKLLTIKWGKQSFKQTAQSLHFHQQPDGVHLLLLEIYNAAVEWVDSQCKSHDKAIKKEFTQIFCNCIVISLDGKSNTLLLKYNFRKTRKQSFWN